MVKHNLNITKLQSSYLFPEVTKRKNNFLEKNPQAKLISLSIGDTTEPIPSPITTAMHDAALRLASKEGYEGYGPEQGLLELRQKITQQYYPKHINSDDMFINDGAKCDIGRLQMFFGQDVKVAMQDPAYPVYVDGSVLAGQTGDFCQTKEAYNDLTLLACTPKNNFFPHLSKLSNVDLIYFCSPHNPTGAVASKKQLEELVDYARKNRSIIIYDSAYAFYIQDSDLPKSIYEIEGADEVAIEVGSFSKLAGFTGVRLGWSIIPSKLKFEDGLSVKKLWIRFLSTVFNGASNIAQYGGLACMGPEGQSEIQKIIQFYLENARILKKAIDQKFQTFGNINAPYIWTYMGDQSSWDYFNLLLEKAHLVTVPGSGFGSNGEGFIRFSSFGSRENILKAAERLQQL
ncbi:MAG: LL-diaminopimelate aminotransferase [Chlamydiae bacterium]|nr:LL-diaminopimelate aminotransferase [Chlamydiota bacterium]